MAPFIWDAAECLSSLSQPPDPDSVGQDSLQRVRLKQRICSGQKFSPGEMGFFFPFLDDEPWDVLLRQNSNGSNKLSDDRRAPTFDDSSRTVQCRSKKITDREERSSSAISSAVSEPKEIQTPDAADRCCTNSF